MVAFMVFATIVYYLPLSRIRAEVDANLAAVAAEIQRWETVRMRDGTVSIIIDPGLSNLETASTFFIITDKSFPPLMPKSSVRIGNGLVMPF